MIAPKLSDDPKKYTENVFLNLILSMSPGEGLAHKHTDDTKT